MEWERGGVGVRRGVREERSGNGEGVGEEWEWEGSEEGSGSEEWEWELPVREKRGKDREGGMRGRWHTTTQNHHTPE